MTHHDASSLACMHVFKATVQNAFQKHNGGGRRLCCLDDKVKLSILFL